MPWPIWNRSTSEEVQATRQRSPHNPRKSGARELSMAAFRARVCSVVNSWAANGAAASRPRPTRTPHPDGCEPLTSARPCSSERHSAERCSAKRLYRGWRSRWHVRFALSVVALREHRHPRRYRGTERWSWRRRQRERHAAAVRKHRHSRGRRLAPPDRRRECVGAGQARGQRAGLVAASLIALAKPSTMAPEYLPGLAPFVVPHK